MNKPRQTTSIQPLYLLLAVFLMLGVGCGQQSRDENWDVSAPDVAQPFQPDYFGARYEPQSALAIHPDNHEIAWSTYWREAASIHEKVVTALWAEERFTSPIVTDFSAEYSCGGPLYSPGGDTLYFTTDWPDGNEIEPHNRVWMAQRTESGWDEPAPLDAPFNDEPVLSHVAMDDDGTVIFSRKLDDLGSNDLFSSMVENGQYQPERSLPGALNTEYLEADPWVDPQGQFLLFAQFGSPESQGGMDLFVSFKQDDGTWGPGVNLGDAVNTLDDERYPSLSPDGKALFFTREGDMGGSPHNSYYWISTDALAAFAPLRTNQK